MPAITPGTPLQLLVDLFRTSMGQAFSQALGSSWSVEIGPDDGSAFGETTPLWFGLKVSGGLQGNAAIQFRTADALLLTQKMAKEAPDAAGNFDAARKQALEGLLRQVAEAAATTLKTQVGDLGIEIASIESPAGTGVPVNLSATEASAAALPVQLWVSAELLAGLPQPEQSTVDNASSAGANNMDLLLGVDLSLTLRFGQRTLTLREILDLSSGSVIELDRRVQEPADLLLGDKLIARGEVVIVDGNYGLRVTEVCDPNHSTSAAMLTAAR